MGKNRKNKYKINVLSYEQFALAIGLDQPIKGVKRGRGGKKADHKMRTLVTRSLFVIGGIEFLISGILYLWSIPAFRQTIVLATTVQPERFTELYFENHTNLPKKAEVNTDYSFKFTVHNLEYRDTNYPYEVFILENGEKTLIDKGNFSLKQDGYKTIGEKLVITEPIKDKAEVVVDLTKKDQKIFFRVAGGTK